MSRPISRAEIKDEVNEIWKECQKEGGRMSDFERGYRQGQADYFRWVKTFSGGKPNYVIPPETQGSAQVSPSEFIHIVTGKEDLTGKPLIWAQWPNEEKNK